MDNILAIQDKIELHEADLKDLVSLKKALAGIKPDRIFHLAAQSFVPTSWNTLRAPTLPSPATLISTLAASFPTTKATGTDPIRYPMRIVRRTVVAVLTPGSWGGS